MKSSRNNKLILSMLFVSCIFCFIDKSAINFAIIPIKGDFGLGSDELGMIMSAFFLAYASTQAISGYLVDRFGSRYMLSAGVLLWSAGTAFSGLSAGLSHLVASRFLVGLGEGVYPPGSSVAVAESFQQKDMAKAKSILSSGASIGFAAGALIVPFLISYFNWRSMFLILGASGLLISWLLFLVLSKKSKSGSPEKQPDTARGKALVMTILKQEITWKIAICYFFTNIVFWGLQSWLPSYWISVKGMSMVSMGTWSALPPVAGFLSFIFSGWLLDKYFSGCEKYLVIIGAIGSALFIWLMLSASSIPLAFAYLTISNVFLNAISITIFVIIMKRFPVNMVGTATGVINSISQIGSFISPLLLGTILKWTNQNYTVIFEVLIIFSLITALSAASLKNKTAPVHAVLTV